MPHSILIFYLNHANLYRPHFWNLRGAIERPYRIIACGIKFSEFDEQDQGVVVRDLLAETCAARLNVKVSSQGGLKAINRSDENDRSASVSV